MKKLNGFSLIELLISLIIISLLIGAFAPIITKKLKATDVTVGSFDNRKEETAEKNISRPPTKEDCDKVDALFIPKEMNDGLKDICVTKYNAGDGGIPLAANVTKLYSGETCTKSPFCCWQGKTAGECTENRNGAYSGCNRTICQWEAGYESCNSYSPSGLKSAHWRLPKREEYSGWMNNLNTLNNGKGENGLQICFGTTSLIEGVDQCNGYGNHFLGSYDTHGRPYQHWTSSQYNESRYYNTYFLPPKFSYEGGTLPNNAPLAVRCVLDTVEEIQKNPQDYSPKNQEDCDKVAPYTMFIDKKYNDGFHNVCVTKYNVGDAGGPPYGTGVIQGASGKCSAKNCCWSNTQTANASYCSGKNADSVYGSCKRTACQFEAAKQSCKDWAPNGKNKGYWRLPKKAELDGWVLAVQMYDFKGVPTISRGLGSKGLQFCNYHRYTVKTGDQQCFYGSCPGAGEDACHNSNIYGFDNGINYILGYGSNETADIIATAQENHTINGIYAYSVRCVYDGIDHSGDS